MLEVQQFHHNEDDMTCTGGQVVPSGFCHRELFSSMMLEILCQAQPSGQRGIIQSIEWFQTQKAMLRWVVNPELIRHACHMPPNTHGWHDDGHF